MNHKTRWALFAALCGLLAFNMAPSCGDDDDSGPTTVDCEDGSSLELGAECQAVYDDITACCADEAIGTEKAASVVCGMQGNEDACKAGGSISANAACAQLEMRPECTEGGSDADADTDADTDTDADSDTDTSGIMENPGFEQGLTGWTIIEGTAFTGMPQANCPNAGTCFGLGVSTYVNGENAGGKLASASFNIEKRYVCWKAGGFAPNHTEVDFGVDGTADLTVDAPGTNGDGTSGDGWFDQCADLDGHQGEEVRFVLVDQNTEFTYAWAAWDEFRASDTQ